MSTSACKRTSATSSPSSTPPEQALRRLSSHPSRCARRLASRCRSCRRKSLPSRMQSRGASGGSRARDACPRCTRQIRPLQVRGSSAAQVPQPQAQQARRPKREHTRHMTARPQHQAPLSTMSPPQPSRRVTTTTTTTTPAPAPALLGPQQRHPHTLLQAQDPCPR